MTHHEHDPQHHGRQHEHHHTHKRRGIHRDWRVWLAVAIMLGAMFMYVMSMDESLAPGGGGQVMPAAEAPPAP